MHLYRRVQNSSTNIRREIIHFICIFRYIKRERKNILDKDKSKEKHKEEREKLQLRKLNLSKGERERVGM